MPEVTDYEEEFNAWFHENDGFILRSERLYIDLNKFRTREAQAASMVLWLQAAYKQGAKDAAQDAAGTLRQYATALSGVEPEMVTPEQQYDKAADSLDVYFKDVLK